MNKNHHFSITFDDELYNQVKLIADKNGISIAETVRILVGQSLDGELSKSNLDYISKIIRTQLRDVLQPSVERLAALSAKTCVQAGTAAYLTAETIAKFVPDDLQEDVMDTYERSRKKAVAYTQQKGDLT